MATDPRITNTTSLEELHAAITEINRECFANDLDTEDFYEIDNLPTFGGEPLAKAEGLFSWDAERVLMGDTTADAFIVSRVEYLKTLDD
jgi:hypothetical protein